MAELKLNQLVKNRQVKSVSLSVDYLQKAEKVIVQQVQRMHYKNEIKCFSDQQSLAKSSPLNKLDPIMVDGILRVGGRLARANISFNAKHPALLPQQSKVSNLLLQNAHVSVGHLGKNAMNSFLRQKY